jgi:hypothetical protein
MTAVNMEIYLSFSIAVNPSMHVLLKNTKRHYTARGGRRPAPVEIE